MIGRKNRRRLARGSIHYTHASFQLFQLYEIYFLSIGRRVSVVSSMALVGPGREELIQRLFEGDRRSPYVTSN